MVNSWFEQGLYGSWKTWKVMEFKYFSFQAGKSWNSVVGPGKLLYMVSQMLQNSTTCTFIFNNLYLCSTRYIYIQHFIFIFNNAHFLSTSTKIIFIQQNICSISTKIIFIQQNICSISTKIIFIQQKYLFNFNQT